MPILGSVSSTKWAGFTSETSIYATGGDYIYEYSEGGFTYRAHTFTSAGNFVVTRAAPTALVEFLLVAGGGGGSTLSGGGGGGGGVLQGNFRNIALGSYPVVIGAGGAIATNGANSTFYGNTAIGGGAGGEPNFIADGGNGTNGGSGGGGGGTNSEYSGGLGGQGTVGQGVNGSSGLNDGTLYYSGDGCGKYGCAGGILTGDYGTGGNGGSLALVSNLNGVSRVVSIGGTGYKRGTSLTGASNTGNGGGYQNAGGSGIAIIRYRIPGAPDPALNPVITGSQISFTSPGTYSWTVPTGVTSVCVVAVGGGGGGRSTGGSGGSGGGGGGLGWKNNISVTPGQTYTVVVGQGGNGGTSPTAGTASYFIDTSTVRGGGGAAGSTSEVSGGTYTGDGGGNGGVGYYSGGGAGGGGGGAGGYAGTGGNSGSVAGTGGAGAGGNTAGGAVVVDGGGGGVGLLGQGTSGSSYGAGGSGGQSSSERGLGNGGDYGGGGSGNDTAYTAATQNGASGAVRIIWGAGRAFPNTNTGNV